MKDCCKRKIVDLGLGFSIKNVMSPGENLCVHFLPAGDPRSALPCCVSARKKYCEVNYIVPSYAPYGTS